jgi:hypothetical protein
MGFSKIVPDVAFCDILVHKAHGFGTTPRPATRARAKAGNQTTAGAPEHPHEQRSSTWIERSQ